MLEAIPTKQVEHPGRGGRLAFLLAATLVANCATRSTQNSLLDNLAEGNITTVAGGYVGDNGPALDAALSSPAALVVDAAGNILVAERDGHRVRRLDPRSGIINTIAGTGVPGWSGNGGPATAAQLDSPASLTLDLGGNLYIGFARGIQVRRVDATTGIITKVAGTNASGPSSGDGGLATAARFSGGSLSVLADSVGNLFIADSGANRIRRVDAATGIIQTIAGTGAPFGFSGDGGQATAAEINRPSGMALDAFGNLLFADADNQRVRRVDLRTGIITLIAGSGSSVDGAPATMAYLNTPTGVTVERNGDLLIFEWGANQIRRVEATTGIIRSVAGTRICGFSGDGGQATQAHLALSHCPTGVAGVLRADGAVVPDGSGGLLITDTVNDRIRRVDMLTGLITTIAGIGIGDGRLATRVILHRPGAITLDAAGNLLIGEIEANRVRRVDARTGIITTVAGTGEVGIPQDGILATATKLQAPGVNGLAVESAGHLYIGQNGRVIRVDAVTGMIRTVAGSSTSACFSSSPTDPCGDGAAASSSSLGGVDALALDAVGNLFITDTFVNRIRRVDGTTGIITTVVGTGEPGDSGDLGPATAAKLRHPRGIATDGAGNIFFSDGGARVRRVDAATQMITRVAGGAPGFAGDGGAATSAQLIPHTVGVDRGGNLFVGDGGNERIREIYAATGIITTVAGSGIRGQSGDGGPAKYASLLTPYRLALDSAGNVYITSGDRIRAVRTIVDTTPPTIVVPPDISVPATGPSGADVSYAAPTATDTSPISSVACIPPSGATFAVGTTTVTCTATDAAGNAGSATFSITVLGPVAQTQSIVGLVTSLNLPSGIENSLLSKLQAVIDALNAGNVATACNQIDAFINDVQAQSGNSMTAEQAMELITAANQVKATMQCS